MKTIIVSIGILIGLAAMASTAPADLPDLPGMSEPGAAAPSEDIPMRPDAQTIMFDVSSNVKITSKQEDQISGALEKKVKMYDKMLKEYDESVAEQAVLNSRITQLKDEMTTLNKDIPDMIRGYLDEEQRQAFDAMVEAKSKPVEPPPAQEEVKPLSITAPEEPPAPVAKPAKKKKLIKRRKMPKAASVAPAGSAEPVAQPAVAPAEEEGGGVMVDNDAAPAAGKIKKKKKRVLRKKAAAKPAEDIMSDEPAAPAEAKTDASTQEEAGSYP